MADTQQPPNPSRRRLFSWLTDSEEAGKIGAEAGRLMRQAQELAQELNDVAQDAAEAVTEPLVAPEAPPESPQPPAIPAVNADLHAEVQRLGTAVAAVRNQIEFVRQLQIENSKVGTAAVLQIVENISELARQLKHVELLIAEEQTQVQGESSCAELQPLAANVTALQIQLVDYVRELRPELETAKHSLAETEQHAQNEGERTQSRHLGEILAGLVAALLTATGNAVYEALVGDAVYEPLKAWLLEMQQAGSVQAQPASPVQTPEAKPSGSIDTYQVRTLRAIMQDRHRPAKERLEAGLRLSDLGVLPKGLDDFIAVPGTYFRIGKYPVTNHQFRRFVEAGGYGVKGGWRPPWWSVNGWKERQERDWTAPSFWENARFNWATQPVVAISLYEAEAYCAWLTHVGSVPAGFRAQLPTETQWMLAARNGREQAPVDEVDYPWGGIFDPALANTEESGLMRTTPVDMYPDGATKAGVYDLTGNVWEWMSVHSTDNLGNWYWLKGGSSWVDANSAKASAAVRSNAGGRNDLRGCRVVVIPISCS